MKPILVEVVNLNLRAWPMGSSLLKLWSLLFAHSHNHWLSSLVFVFHSLDLLILHHRDLCNSFYHLSKSEVYSWCSAFWNHQWWICKWCAKVYVWRYLKQVDLLGRSIPILTNSIYVRFYAIDMVRHWYFWMKTMPWLS